MLDKPISSKFRQRMIDDMMARRFKEKVQKDYARRVRTFAAFLGRSPDTATGRTFAAFSCMCQAARRRFNLMACSRSVSG